MAAQLGRTRFIAFSRDPALGPEPSLTYIGAPGVPRPQVTGQARLLIRRWHRDTTPGDGGVLAALRQIETLEVVSLDEAIRDSRLRPALAAWFRAALERPGNDSRSGFVRDVGRALHDQRPRHLPS